MSLLDRIWPLPVAPKRPAPSRGLGAPRPGHAHQGEDYAVSDGASLVAPFSGEVSSVGWEGRSAVYLRGGEYSMVIGPADASVGPVEQGHVIGVARPYGPPSFRHVHIELIAGAPSWGSRELWKSTTPGAWVSAFDVLGGAVAIEKTTKTKKEATSFAVYALGGLALLGGLYVFTR